MTSQPATETRPALLDMAPETLSTLVADLGAPPYRARQIAQAVYRRQRVEFAEMTELPLSLRTVLATRLRVAPAESVARQTSADHSTTKLLLRLDDGELIETVLMRYDPFGRRRARRTVCVSTQAGCAMACVFCATGSQGYRRQLKAGEILLQVLLAARQASDEGSPLTNVVFMGMGEPLANYDETSTALKILRDPAAFGMGPRRVMLSTVGLVAGIRRLGTEHPQVNLAISLHAPDDALRRRLVPVPAAPLAEIVSAAEEHVETTGRRVSIEYVLLAGINDAPAQAAALGRLLRGLRCHVNLIPINPSPGVLGQQPTRTAVLRFQRALERSGVNTTVRVEKGRDIAAACGQLRGDRPHDVASD